jgi:hypothetical protein
VAALGKDVWAAEIVSVMAYYEITIIEIKADQFLLEFRKMISLRGLCYQKSWNISRNAWSSRLIETKGGTGHGILSGPANLPRKWGYSCPLGNALLGGSFFRIGSNPVSLFQR